MITTINEWRKTNEEYVSTKDQLRLLAKEIKNTYKNFKFSITVSYNKIQVYVLSGPIELRLNSEESYEQVNYYYVKDN